MGLSGLARLGVNLSGAEYGHPTASDPGRLWTDYVLPTASEIAYYAGKGFNTIRLPFSWERMQAQPGAALNGVYLAQLDAVVDEAARNGITTILDLHNFGFGWGRLLGTADLPGSAMADLWSRLAAHYRGKDVAFGLMNEPHEQSATGWAAIAAQAVAAIRATGATQQILVPGTAWDGAQGWVTSGNAAALSAAIHDPLGNVVYEVHQYLDPNNSGTSTQVVSPTIGAERLQEATRWAESTGNRLFLGEFAAGQDPASLAALDTMLAFMSQHAAAWQGGTYWAGGLWWGDYPFSVEPKNGQDKPQLPILARYEAAKPAVLPGFDAFYYLAHNPDVAAAGVDPVTHFLISGWHEGRNPNAVFDTHFYLVRNPDVAAAGVDPLVHYVADGAREGRLPSLVFDPKRYLAENPDVAAAGVDPMLHFIGSGQGEGRASPPVGGSAQADPLIDPRFLLSQLGATLLPAGAAAASQAAWFYANGGWQAGLDPAALFRTSYYLASNPDVARAQVDPLLHFEVSGWREGRNPSPAFDSAAYLRHNPDVAAAGVDPLLHYLVSGLPEGRAIYAVPGGS